MARDWSDYGDYYSSYIYPTRTSTYSFWWGAPSGMSDYDLYDYNNNYVLDDDEIKDIVMDNIAADAGITWSDQNKINIQVNDGVVTLSGEVRNPRTKPLAYTDAYWSTGVVDVVNNINVRERKRQNQSNAADDTTE